MPQVIEHDQSHHQGQSLLTCLYSLCDVCACVCVCVCCHPETVVLYRLVWPLSLLEVTDCWVTDCVGVTDQGKEKLDFLKHARLVWPSLKRSPGSGRRPPSLLLLVSLQTWPSAFVCLCVCVCSEVLITLCVCVCVSSA